MNQTPDPTPTPAKITHWVRWDDPGIRDRHTLCGLLIRATEHSNSPTCPTCIAILDAHERDTP